MRCARPVAAGAPYLWWIAPLCLLLLLSLSALARAQAPPGEGGAADGEFEYADALAISQGAIGNRVGDYLLTATDGQQVRMSQLHGKPMVLSLIYTSCYQICPMTTRHLATVVEKARAALGHDSFSVVAIGFDTNVDTPSAMRHFARQQGIEDAGWLLFSIGPEEMKSLARDVGLVYLPSARGFDHIIQATVITAEGEVYRQVYGQVFDTPLLVEPLKELVLGRPRSSGSFVTDLVNRIRFFCTTYDPVRDGYYFDYSLFIGMFIGATIILLSFAWMVSEIRRRRSSMGAGGKPGLRG